MQIDDLSNKETTINNNNNNNNKSNYKVKNLIIIGMAGSGKTTFIQKLEESIINYKQTKYNSNNNIDPYLINLDPAVYNCLYEPNLDIRDTVNYKEIMKAHSLGPNGAIVTSLNLFSTNIHKVIDLLDNKIKESFSVINSNNLNGIKDSLEIIVDTPGQLEVFSWSASGKIITDSLSLLAPTIIFYVVDLVRCQNPNTFISNMMYALSIMYKMKLDLYIVFNKSDTVKDDKCTSWLVNYSLLQSELDKDKTYLSTFSNSLCLTLEEFYKTIKYYSVSSKTGEGFDNLIKDILTYI